MEVVIKLGQESFVLEREKVVDLSIAVNTNSRQLSAFHLPSASFEPFKAGSFVGDTRQGAGVNCETVTFCPHGNGTHTECVGHITKKRISVLKVLNGSSTLFPSLLLSVIPQPISSSGDDYDTPHSNDELVISLSSIKNSLEKLLRENDGISSLLKHIKAVIVRTLPNEEEKKRLAQYSGNQPTFFTPKATKFLSEELKVDHLLVDLPSVDRESDEGKLLAHKAFWRFESEEKLTEENVPRGTITELCFIPNQVSDGIYLLDLQVAPFDLDAAPSRPFLYPITKR
eukprot:TRINITY_DN4335_c0_g1_i2.p1 TRINITY_DN4335_c0_g1~~TRINITY_DN4335_c0_g1_i2.p1  ORF type:complete len:285 (-),score=119.34 TRINITY_DN4335_c0_g1_i2:31-885(-)